MKNDESVTRLFRNSDQDESVPELVPDIKQEVIDTKEGQEGWREENTEKLTDMNGSSKKAQFVQVKNRQVFDYEPNASSIHASLWPHWWLKAVHARHQLRKKEAQKNVRFKAGLRDLFKEALEVGTILFCSIFIRLNI